MLKLNPFAHKTSSYHRLSNTTADSESDTCASPNSSTQKEEHDVDRDLLLASKPRPSRRRSCIHACGYLFAALFGLSIGLGVSQLFNLEYGTDGFITQYGSPHRNVEHVSWSVNDSFVGLPSAETEKTWESLMPIGRGFVTHPKLAKEPNTVAVFHEIHCLHGLRQSYYKNAYRLAKLQHQHTQSRSLPHTGPPHSDPDSLSDHEAAHDEPSVPVFTPSPYMESLLSAKHDHGPDHATHCFEYLRQALMCAADTNLEDTYTYVDEDGKAFLATDGWSSEKICRDFEAVREWAEKWRTGDAGGIV